MTSDDTAASDAAAAQEAAEAALADIPEGQVRLTYQGVADVLGVGDANYARGTAVDVDREAAKAALATGEPFKVEGASAEEVTAEAEATSMEDPQQRRAPRRRPSSPRRRCPMPDVTKIHLGPGDVWVTPDTTLGPPTKGVNMSDPTTSALMAFTTNFASPSTSPSPAWRNVGFTNGPATLTYRPTYYMVETEQAFAEVIVVPTTEEATLACTMQELDYQNMLIALGQATSKVTVGPPASNALFLGGKSNVNLATFCLLSRKRTGIGYFVSTLYQAYSSEGAPLNFERRAETRLPLTMRVLADATRPVGDQLFQIVEYPANP